MSVFNPILEVLPDAEALAHRVAGWLLDLASEKHGTFTVALSGGSTPKRLYELLAQPPFCGVFPWARTHWFWGDERFVPQDDPQSNYHMAHEAMLMHAPVPAANIHPVPTATGNPEAAAEQYQQQLKTVYGADKLQPDRPFFDVVLLGLGEDGHTASLFPDTKVLDIRDQWVATVMDAKSLARITLTYPLLESSWHTAFLIAGKGKRAIFERLRKGDQALPASRLHPQGSLTWFVDEAANGQSR